MEWLSIFSQPVTQIVGLGALIVALQKAGIDVGGIVRTFLKMDEGVQSIDNNNRNVSQQLLSQMELLSGHFNHETTELLSAIKEGIENTNRKLEEFEKYGIPCRDK